MAEMGLPKNAFYLAEKYRDYRTMAILTHTYDREPEQRINEYLNSFGKQFVYAVYDWYLAKGKYCNINRISADISCRNAENLIDTK